jgi:2,3-bisphosphoglycerate-dependent phosphoglycerate mutase
MARASLRQDVSVTTLLLARHGETDWNRARRWQGHADRPLTARGRAQAAELAERLADIALDAVYSSDLRRARETAEAVAQAQGVDLVQLAELREVSVGSWEGLTREEAEARFPNGFRRWLAGGTGWDDGETYAEMSKRVLVAVDRIASEAKGSRVLIVSHGGPIRAIHGAALGMEVEAYRRIRPVEPNARLSAVCVEDGRLTELCPAGGIDELLTRDQEERRQAAAQPPSPAG